MEKAGVELEVGLTTIVLELVEEEYGYTKKVYQISSSSTGTGHNVSLSLIKTADIKGHISILAYKYRR